MLKGGLIKPGQLIDYEQFSNLHELYKYLMNEKEFAVALEITTERLWGIKNGGRTRILKGVQGELVRIKGMQKTDLGKACIEMLNKYKELGLEKAQAIKETEEMLGISPEVLLKAMKDYEAEQKKREAVQNEGVAIGG